VLHYISAVVPRFYKGPSVFVVVGVVLMMDVNIKYGKWEECCTRIEINTYGVSERVSVCFRSMAGYERVGVGVGKRSYSHVKSSFLNRVLQRNRPTARRGILRRCLLVPSLDSSLLLHAGPPSFINRVSIRLSPPSFDVRWYLLCL